MDSTVRQINLPHRQRERERGFALGVKLKEMSGYFGFSKKGNLQTQTVGFNLFNLCTNEARGMSSAYYFTQF